MTTSSARVKFLLVVVDTTFITGTIVGLRGGQLNNKSARPTTSLTLSVMTPKSNPVLVYSIYNVFMN